MSLTVPRKTLLPPPSGNTSDAGEVRVRQTLVGLRRLLVPSVGLGVPLTGVTRGRQDTHLTHSGDPSNTSTLETVGHSLTSPPSSSTYTCKGRVTSVVSMSLSPLSTPETDPLPLYKTPYTPGGTSIPGRGLIQVFGLPLLCHVHNDLLPQPELRVLST